MMDPQHTMQYLGNSYRCLYSFVYMTSIKSKYVYKNLFIPWKDSWVVVNAKDLAKESLRKGVQLVREYGSVVMDVWLRLITSLVPTAKRCHQCAFSVRFLQQDRDIVVAGGIVGRNVGDNKSTRARSEVEAVMLFAISLHMRDYMWNVLARSEYSAV